MFDMEGAVDAEFVSRAGGCEIEMRNAFWRERVTQRWIEKAKVKFAGNLGLPARMSEVFNGACDLEYTVLGSARVRGQAERAEICGFARQIDGGLQQALCLCWGAL